MNAVIHNATPNWISVVFPAGAGTRFWCHDLILWLLPIILLAQVIVWSALLPAWGLEGIAHFHQVSVTSVRFVFLVVFFFQPYSKSTFAELHGETPA